MNEYPKLVYKGEGWRKVASLPEEQAAQADGFFEISVNPQPKEKMEKPPERRKRHGSNNASDPTD